MLGRSISSLHNNNSRQSLSPSAHAPRCECGARPGFSTSPPFALISMGDSPHAIRLVGCLQFPQSMTVAELSPHRLVTLILSALLESHPRKALQAPSVLQHTYSRSCLCAAHPVCAILGLIKCKKRWLECTEYL